MIIEIPDENSVIKWKNNEKDEWKSAEISDLINAYEERPQGELISRDALKEDFNLIASKSATGEWFSIPIKHIKQIIDNATSVEQEVYMHGEDYNFFIRGYKEGRKDFERQKGEWITTRTMTHDGNPYCTVCDEENIIRSKFCPNCGADMRKGGKQ